MFYSLGEKNQKNLGGGVASLGGGVASVPPPPTPIVRLRVNFCGLFSEEPKSVTSFN